MDAKSDLPKGWVKTTFDEVCLPVERVNPTSYYDIDFDYIDIGAVDNVLHKLDKTKRLSVEGTVTSRAKQLVKENDILLSTTRVYLENIAQVPAIFDGQIASTAFSVLRPAAELIPKLLFFYIKSKSFIHLLTKLQRGNSPPAVLDDDVRIQTFLLPPAQEQNRIVSKIEELFSELDNGVATLKATKKQLKTYHHSILKHAFEGKLTTHWREKHADELEPVESLREKIKIEREKRLQQQLDDWAKTVEQWEVDGKPGKKPAKPRKLKELPPITEKELKELPSLPDSWEWIRLSTIFAMSPQNGLYKPASEYGEGYWIVRIDDFYDGSLIKKAGFKRLKLTRDELNKFLVEENNILVNRVNSIEFLGKCCLVEGLEEPIVFESNIMKLQFLQLLGNAKFISKYLSSNVGLDELRKNAKHAINQASINQTDVSSVCFPLCSLREQLQIMQEIESSLSEIANLEQTLENSLKQAEAMRQSILKAAFEGKLVPQDPNDEPASKLLERIKAEKASLTN